MGLLAKVNSILGVDLPRIKMDHLERPRPYPYDVTAILALTDGGAPDTFPVGYTQLIPAGTYDFGDGAHNRIHLHSLEIEVMPADTFIVEFYRSADAVTYTPIGAVRISNTVAITLVYSIQATSRPLCITHNALYGRVKTASGGGVTIQFSLSVCRWLPPTFQIPISTGVWPWG